MVGIVDSQVHIWDDSSQVVANWPPGQAIQPWTLTPLTVERLIEEMDVAGVSRAFLVPPAFDGIGSNAYSLAAAAAHPERFVVMGRLPLDAADGPELVERWAEEPLGRGIRMSVFMPRQREWLADGGLDWFWAAAERLGLPLMIYPGPVPELLRAIARIAQRHENLKISIDHMAAGPYDQVDDAAFAHLPDLLALADLPNLAVKASALPEHSSEPYPHRNIHPYIRRTIDAFGPERVFWGTDLPRLHVPYRNAVTMFTEELGLSDRERDLVMGEAICAWHSWS
jgi:L-fuconolactonase